MKTFVLKVLPVAVMMGLVGCQGIQPKLSQSAPVSVLEAPQTIDTANAKQTVQAGVKALLRTSFSYQTQAYIRPKPIASSLESLPNTACEEIHDNAYIALSKKAEEAGLDISADDYVQERTTLKQEFLACTKARAEGSETLTPEDELARLLAELSMLANQPATDFNDEQLNEKRQHLIHEYYLKVAKLGMIGDYRPLQGVVRALPSFEYRFGQAYVMVNQPMVFDFKSGDIYVWADNLALANATWLDKKLGNAWHNKWLRVPLNDGSLPDDFVKTLLTHYMTAQSEAFLALDEADFEQVGADELLATTEGMLDDKARTHILTAKTIIRQHNDGDTQSTTSRAVAKFLYDKMTTDYPVLLEKPIALDNKKETLMLDSRALMQYVFAKLGQASHDGQSDDDVVESDGDVVFVELEGGTLEGAEAESAEVEDIEAESVAVESAEISDNDPSESETLVNDILAISDLGENPKSEPVGGQDIYYGFDARGKLLWIYRQQEQALPKSWLKDPVDLGLLTVLDGAVSRQMFERLPAMVAAPTPANSVNVLEYSNTLYNTLKKSDSIFLRSFFYYLTSAFESKDETEKQPDTEDKTEAENQAETKTDGDNAEK